MQTLSDGFLITKFFGIFEISSYENNEILNLNNLNILRIDGNNHDSTEQLAVKRMYSIIITHHATAFLFWQFTIVLILNWMFLSNDPKRKLVTIYIYTLHGFLIYARKNAISRISHAESDGIFPDFKYLYEWFVCLFVFFFLQQYSLCLNTTNSCTQSTNLDQTYILFQTKMPYFHNENIWDSYQIYLHVLFFSMNNISKKIFGVLTNIFFPFK